MAYNFSDFKKRLLETEEHLKKEFFSIRTGRATPALLDGISAESYGSKMPLNQLGSMTAEDARTLRFVPWDMGGVKAAEKAIVSANLGVSVSVDEKGIRIFFPELSAERRESLIKIAKEKLESTRIAIRTERDHVWNDIQKKEKDGAMSEDDKFRGKDEMQKLVDDANKKLEEAFEKKKKEIES